VSPATVAPTAETIYGELRSLCKGLGLRHPRVRDRAGHALRAVCSVTSSTTHDQARQLLVARLREAAAELPDGPRLRLRQAASVALALDGLPTRLLVLGQRQNDAAVEWQSDVRTVRRRCDHALRLLGSILARESDAPTPVGWYYDRISVFLRLDIAQPQIRQERAIVAEVEGLTGIELCICIPQHPKEKKRSHVEMETEVEYGVGASALEQRDTGKFVHQLSLPGPLSIGQLHTYSFITRLSADLRMRPHFVCAPSRRCDRLDLHVKFDPRRLPRVVWAVTAASMGSVRPDVPGPDVRAPDSLGEVQVSFSKLRPGYGYGLYWLVKNN
jgi:hypothetical protein